MMGVPEEDRRAIYELGNRMVGFDDPDLQPTASRASERTARRPSARCSCTPASWRSRRARIPADDLATALLNAEIDGQKLSELDFNFFFLLLLVAGNETTRTVTTNGMLDLIHHPDQLRDAAQQDRSLLPSAVEEILRYEPAGALLPPHRHARHRAARRSASAKATRSCCGTRRPTATRRSSTSPTSFDIRRTPNDHLAFGIGEHFCLGANLARMELHEIFRGILTRLHDIELAAPARRLRSNFVNGVKEMRVEFTPTKRLRIDD